VGNGGLFHRPACPFLTATARGGRVIGNVDRKIVYYQFPLRCVSPSPSFSNQKSTVHRSTPFQWAGLKRGKPAPDPGLLDPRVVTKKYPNRSVQKTNPPPFFFARYYRPGPLRKTRKIFPTPFPRVRLAPFSRNLAVSGGGGKRLTFQRSGLNGNGGSFHGRPFSQFREGLGNSGPPSLGFFFFLEQGRRFLFFPIGQWGSW